jgi:hypothetical protein
MGCPETSTSPKAAAGARWSAGLNGQDHLSLELRPVPGPSSLGCWLLAMDGCVDGEEVELAPLVAREPRRQASLSASQRLSERVAPPTRAASECRPSCARASASYLAEPRTRAWTSRA